MTQKTLLSIGHGYTAQALARRLLPDGWRIIGTTRDPERAQALTSDHVEMHVYPGSDLTPLLAQASHVLSSAGATEEGDPVVSDIGAQLAEAQHLEWVGYLSTTGVYGDYGGDWVDETTPLSPSTKRGQMRLAAEQDWSGIPGLPVHIFRLAGIYGPGRGPFAKVRNGTARRIIKAGQVFSRIHVEDIAQVLAASIAKPNPGQAYNVCDDDPAPPQDVLAYAAELLDMPPPPETAFETADLSPMARSFYAENKRVRNDRIKDELGVELLYPDYRAGLRALLALETSAP